MSRVVEEARERHEAPAHSLSVVKQALELLGCRLSPVAPDLLKAEPRKPTPGSRKKAFLVTTNPLWVSRAPGVVLAAPGSGLARRLCRAVEERGRFAVFVAQGPGRPRPLRRYLWFRFVLTVTSFALPEGARRSVIDVLAGGESEAPVGRPPDGMRLVAHRQPAAMAWVSAYEVQRLGERALHAAVEKAEAELAALRRRLDAVRQAEEKRVERYFLERRTEEALPLRTLYRRAAVALVYSRLTSDSGRAHGLAERAEKLARLAEAQQKALARRLAALEREEALALSEVEERYRLRARLSPGGLAVVWSPPEAPEAGRS